MKWKNQNLKTSTSQSSSSGVELITFYRNAQKQSLQDIFTAQEGSMDEAGRPRAEWILTGFRCTVEIGHVTMLYSRLVNLLK